MALSLVLTSSSASPSTGSSKSKLPSSASSLNSVSALRSLGWRDATSAGAGGALEGDRSGRPVMPRETDSEGGSHWRGSMNCG